jgi:predicted DCC family thiol-disulfide oxidoreductase YuxK
MAHPTDASSSSGSSGKTSDRELEPERRSQILLYDGLCGFCDRTVQFILRHDPRGPMRFAPLQGSSAKTILARHPELEGVDSLILVEGTGDAETTSIRSEAVLRILAYLGGIWTVSVVLRLVPRPVRDWAYALFARYRYKVFGFYDVCPMPTLEVRERFLP